MRMAKGFFDGAMMLLERSVLFGKLDDVEIWRKGQVSVEGHGDLGKVVEEVLMELMKNGEMDCGCG